MGNIYIFELNLISKQSDRLLLCSRKTSAWTFFASASPRCTSRACGSSTRNFQINLWSQRTFNVLLN